MDMGDGGLEKNFVGHGGCPCMMATVKTQIGLLLLVFSCWIFVTTVRESWDESLTFWAFDALPCHKKSCKSFENNTWCLCVAKIGCSNLFLKHNFFKIKFYLQVNPEQNIDPSVIVSDTSGNTNAIALL